MTLDLDARPTTAVLSSWQPELVLSTGLNAADHVIDEQIDPTAVPAASYWVRRRRALADAPRADVPRDAA